MEFLFRVIRTYEKTWVTKAKDLDEALALTKKVRSRKIEQVGTQITRVATLKKEVPDGPTR